MKEIHLTQGIVALVDDADYEWLNKWKWHALWGGTSSTYYAARDVGKVTILMHRLILDAPNGFDVDHIDHEGTNNQCSNIRVVTRGQNLQNSRMLMNNTSGYRGVVWLKGERKWIAQIRKDYVCIRIGRFTNIIEAARAYDAKALELYGPYAWLNFPNKPIP